MPTEQSLAQLVETASRHLRDYIESGRTRTDYLKLVAEDIVVLRAQFLLEDGRVDWGGRSPAYRAAIHEVYANAHVPTDLYDTVQAALRYHVGNLLRDRARVDELEAVGLSTVSPRERLSRSRDIVKALAAGGTVAEVTGSPARLIAHAEALLDFVDPVELGQLRGTERAAARHGLQGLSSRAAELEAQMSPNG